MTIKIAVINESTVVSDAQVQQVVGPLQKQVTDDAGPVWGISAELRFVPKGQQPAPGEWWLAVLDNSDQADALGYHDITNEGLPLSKVFAGSDKQFGTSWTVTCSHELLEMLVDPDINLTVLEQDQKGARLYAYEVCDACEADNLGYEIDGVLVSDFVYPSWFESFRDPASTQFDHRKQIDLPFKLLPGGYIGVNEIGSLQGWTQVTAESLIDPSSRTPNVRARAPKGSRRERRDVPPQERTLSQVNFGAARRAGDAAPPASESEAKSLVDVTI